MISRDIPTRDHFEFVEWLELGVKKGWISEPVCASHEWPPMRDWEEAEFEAGEDPCIIVSRVWMDGMQDFIPE